MQVKQQLPLFEIETRFDGRAYARHSDPPTSHAAAASISAGALEQRVIDIVARFGLGGCIADDLERLLPDVRSHSLTPRVRPLIDRGILEATGERRLGGAGRWQRVIRCVGRTDRGDAPPNAPGQTAGASHTPGVRGAATPLQT